MGLEVIIVMFAFWSQGKGVVTFALRQSHWTLLDLVSKLFLLNKEMIMLRLRADTFLQFHFHGLFQEITGSFRGCYLVCWAQSDKTTVYCTAGHFWIFTVCWIIMISFSLFICKKVIIITSDKWRQVRQAFLLSITL